MPESEPAQTSPAPSSGARTWCLVTVDVDGASARLLGDEREMLAALSRVLGDAAGGLAWVTHRFQPHGLSLLGAGPRLRVAVHTWPERHAATIDLYGAVPELTQLARRCGESLAGAPEAAPSVVPA